MKLLAIPLYAVSVVASGDWHFDYSLQGLDWPMYEGMCEGMKRQSPIMIDTDNVSHTVIPITFNYTYPPPDDTDDVNYKIVSDGHTIRLSLEDGGSLGTVEYDGRVYEAIQYHFHAPSEHVFKSGEADAEGGDRTGIEMHIVHSLIEGESLDDLLVVGVTFEPVYYNDEIHPGTIPLFEFSKSWKFPRHRSVPKIDRTAKGPHVLYGLFGGEAVSMYHYAGSLTTPPCTESVLWFVATKPLGTSYTTVAKFHQILNYPTTQGNYREVQNYIDGSPGNRNFEDLFLSTGSYSESN
eukprot:GHVO01013840.1.p1 GENE.GHVO01013840.1~~GHVO01013840.1.p1  ORF type:complete len:294 (+),score=52.62 GHVO01013840.1:88-969(+)